LHFSCFWNRPKVVSYLLSKNADVTKCFNDSKYKYDGLTALEIAKKLDRKKIVNLLYAREESDRAILEILCITKSILPKDLRVLIVQTMIFFWRDNQNQLLQMCV